MAFQSIVAKKTLGAALKAARLAAGIGSVDAAKVIDRDRSALSRIESGIGPVDSQRLIKLAHHYGVSDAELAEWQALLQDVRSGDKWWEVYSSWLSPEYAELIALENEAEQLTSVQISLVPGLLQTRSYLEALHDRSPLMMDPDRADALTEIRMIRQRRLSDALPLKLVAIITEAVLHNQYSGDDVHRDQLLHLRRMCDHPQVDIRVVPFRSMVDLSGTALYEFSESSSPVAFFETMLTTLPSVQRDLSIRQIRRMIQSARDAALGPEETATLIDKRLDDMK